MRAAFIMLGLAGLVATPAIADTVKVSLGSHTSAGAGSSQFGFSGFDGSLGTLQQVLVELSGSSSFNATISNSSGPTADYSAKNSVFLYINGINNQPAISETGAGTAAVDPGGNFTGSTSGGGIGATITDATTLQAFTTSQLTGYFLIDPPFQFAVKQNGKTAFASNVAVAGGVTSGTITYSYAPRAGAVPEPASWGLMVGGLGAVGGAMRRRRRAVA